MSIRSPLLLCSLMGGLIVTLLGIVRMTGALTMGGRGEGPRLTSLPGL
jgi:hypothetical protein